MKYYKRNLTEKFLKNLDNDLFLILTGGRQTGKTTFIKYVYNSLLAQKTCYFINLENPEFLQIIDAHPDNLFKITNSLPEDNQIVFIDEIQYLKNPTNFLKYLYDEYKGSLKIIATGSSSFYLDRKFKDSLMGRKRLFHLNTLSFKEFLLFKEDEELVNEIETKQNIPPLHLKKLELYLSEYTSYGGYPSVCLAKDKSEKAEIISEIASDYIQKDIYEARIQDKNKYYFLLKILANQTGSLLNSNEVSNTLGIAATTVEKYLYVMQKSFQIALIRPFYQNIRKEITKMPKAYFLDTGLRNHFSGSFDHIELRNDRGILLENVVFRELLLNNPPENIKFWRTQNKAEIDFVIAQKKTWEVKFKRKEFRRSKFELFASYYPNIKVDCISFDDILPLALNIKLR